MNLFSKPLLPETNKFLAACTTQPSAVWTMALNRLISQLIIDGNWSLLDAMWLFAADNRQNATLNIVNPSQYTIIEAGSPTWTKDIGYTGSGTKYLNTNYSPSTQGVNYTRNNACFGCYDHSITVQNTVDIGIGNLNCYIQFEYKAGTGEYNINGSGATFQDFSNSTAGSLSAVRTSSTAVAIYKNGLSIASASISSQAIVSGNFTVLANEPSQYWSTNTVSMAWIGSGSINQLTFYNAIHSFATTIGF